MITLQELSVYLKGLLQTAEIKDYCPHGLQIEGKENIQKVATGVSADLKTIQQAADLSLDALIVHHGLFWQGDDYRISGVKKRKIQLLMDKGISLLGYHLPLDCHHVYGNNWGAAQDLGWEDMKPFGEYNDILIGVQGNFPKTPIQTFIEKLQDYYKHKAHLALGGKKEVSSAALVSGGAYKSILEAVQEGVDCFITGNFDEIAWNIAYEEKINFIALGHAATEKIGPRNIGKHLSEKFGVQHTFIDTENPF